MSNSVSGAIGTWTRRAALHRLVLAVVVLLAGSGCSNSSSDGDPPASGSTGSTPVLSAPAESPAPSPSISVPAGLSAEESEAVEKAVEAYKRWIAAVDQVTQSGGSDLDAVNEIAAQAALIYSNNEAALYVQNGWHSIGDTVIHRIGIENVSLRKDPDTNTVPEVILTSCVDASNIDVLDQSGESVVTDGHRVFEERTWVRYYPQSEYPQVGAGVDGWVIGQYRNKEVASC